MCSGTDKKAREAGTWKEQGRGLEGCSEGSSGVRAEEWHKVTFASLVESSTVRSEPVQSQSQSDERVPCKKKTNPWTTETEYLSKNIQQGLP